jgi:hypothetical protein
MLGLFRNDRSGSQTDHKAARLRSPLDLAKQTFALAFCASAKGQEETHAPQQKPGRFIGRIERGFDFLGYHSVRRD